MELLRRMNGRACSCGREHRYDVALEVGAGVLATLPDHARRLGAGKVFLLSDPNTHKAAGERVRGLLEEAGIPCADYCLPHPAPEPDEKSVGSLGMHFDGECRVIIAVGSGVINDLGKLLSCLTGRPYIIVATAPSMDGYASASSSMTRDGLKVSLATRCPDVILGDTDILCQAPPELMRAGLGDMLAKYVSICEWRIAQLVTGEYYCPQVAQLIREAVDRCVTQAPGLLRRQPEAVQAVFEGLVAGGLAMKFAGVSRPASGVEHYISHVLDMRGVEKGTPVAPHGIQCALGTLIALRLYEKLRTLTPDREKAVRYVNQFRQEAWFAQLRALLGRGAEAMIAQEARERKYDPALHGPRLDRILENWPRILEILDQELPQAQGLETLLQELDMPTCLSQLGVEEALLPQILRATKDIRDKYVLTRLLWDLGVLEELV